MTRSKASPGKLQAVLSDNILPGMQKLALYTKEAMPDMAHYMELLTYAEYAYATSNVQLKSRSEGEKVVVIPNTCEEAMGLPKAAFYKEASDKETKSLDPHDVYDLVPSTSIPAGHKPVGSRWVFKLKADKTFNGRLVVQGWREVAGVDCGGTFSPVCRIQSIRMVLATAVEFHCDILQLDVQTSFLNADVEEEVYVKMAPDYEQEGRC